MLRDTGLRGQRLLPRLILRRSTFCSEPQKGKGFFGRLGARIGLGRRPPENEPVVSANPTSRSEPLLLPFEGSQ